MTAKRTPEHEIQHLRGQLAAAEEHIDILKRIADDATATARTEHERANDWGQVARDLGMITGEEVFARVCGAHRVTP